MLLQKRRDIPWRTRWGRKVEKLCTMPLPRYKVAILDQERYIKNYWNFQINTYQPLLLFKKSFKEFINLQEPKSWSEISIFITIYYHWSNFFSWLRQSQIHSFTQMVAISCRQPKSPIKSLQFVAGWWGSWSKGLSVVVRCWKISVQTLLGRPCRTRNSWSKKSIARTAVWLTPKNFHFESYQSGSIWRTGHRAGLGWQHLCIKWSLQCWYLSYLSDQYSSVGPLRFRLKCCLGSPWLGKPRRIAGKWCRQSSS